MPKIQYADQATQIAVTFLKEHHPIIRRPLSAKPDQGKWVVKVDIGAFFERVATVLIDGETGGILEFEVPPSPFPKPPPGFPQP